MKIRLIDVDSHNFPNLPLMKLSAWHKKMGDDVGIYSPLDGRVDKVYASKVFSFTPDYVGEINAKEVIKRGTGYCIENINGKEMYEKQNDIVLPFEIEHTYPDYDLFSPQTKNTAFGFLSRGCPRGCDFCIVGNKEGMKSIKVANLSEFWDGQKNITLLDPNITACPDWEDLILQLIDSRACINFSQGVDIRNLTDEKAKMLSRVKVKTIHFAWDRYRDKKIIIDKLKAFKDLTGWGYRKMVVYILTNYDTSIDQDLERIYTVRSLGFWPYVMIYNKSLTSTKDEIRKIQRWVNNRFIFEKCKRYEDYKNL